MSNTFSNEKLYSKPNEELITIWGLMSFLQISLKNKLKKTFDILDFF